MKDIELHKFQTEASDKMVMRFYELSEDIRRPTEYNGWATPFYQALSALPGAGKTPILADTVSQLRAAMKGEPIVLWISKAKAVVEQTYTNFQAGGKYAHLIEGFVVCSLSELSPEQIRDVTTPVICLATVGTFNQIDKQDGSLRVHKVGEDRGDESLWDLIRNRPKVGGLRRPLIIAYDEGHNLSDQQTELLLELEPDVILVASATMRNPARLARLIQRLRDYGWTDDDLVTSVNSKDIVEAELVKRQIVIGGYATIMEEAIGDMVESMAVVAKKAKKLRAGFTPKAIYVCRTNISQDDGTADNPSRPFNDRQAAPIQIWRYLVEVKGVPPEEIAVYCDLKFDRRNFPPPEGFIHFSGGEEDFAVFTAGKYRHVIFNRSLEEGWDDPECCFAYIDKSMGSSIQVEQVIGRLLRQPGAKHYPDADLNTANFYIRIDNRSVFPAILELVRRKITAEMPEIKMEAYSNARDRERTREEPKELMTVPEIHVITNHEPMFDAIAEIPNFRGETEMTTGRGERLRAVQQIGDGDSNVAVEIDETPHSNRVMARWIVRRGVQSLYPRASATVDWADTRFDAKVEMTSTAAGILRTSAERLVQVYLDNSELSFEDGNPYVVGPVIVKPLEVQTFKYALHRGYSDLSEFEIPFARAIDATKKPWVRNPRNGGFSIPLLQIGSTYNFFPDFVVWKDDVVFCLDPKGEHLIASDAGRKLLDIRDENDQRKVIVRLFTKGKWRDEKTQETVEGFTVWYLGRGGKIRKQHCGNPAEAVAAALNPRL